MTNREQQYKEWAEQIVDMQKRLDKLEDDADLYGAGDEELDEARELHLQIENIYKECERKKMSIVKLSELVLKMDYYIEA